MSQLKERYRRVVVGEVSCFDRVVINGTLTEICHTAAVAQYLISRKERLLDMPRVFERMKIGATLSIHGIPEVSRIDGGHP